MTRQTLPTGVSIRSLKSNPESYIDSLNRMQSIGLAEYLDYRYHTKNNSPVDDEVYDLLIDHIRQNWPRARYLKKIGHKVETKPRNGVVEVKLDIPMPSMDKIKPGNGTVDKFTGGRAGTYVISDKLDGISLELVYENGKLIRALTRGDGIKGQDVSGVIPALRVPKTIPVKGKFVPRLEFIVPHKTFSSKFSKYEGKGEFATGRNMGGGLLTRNQPSANVKAFRCVAYDIIGGTGSNDSISKKLARLKKLGFTVVAHKKISGVLDDARLTKLHDLRKKKSIYDIDGIIITKDIAAAPTRTNPKHAKAFKVNSLANSQVVAVREVEWRKSRVGKWIPRIRIDPIILGGVEVQYFTAHNAFFIRHGFKYQDRDKGLPVRPINVGAKIRVLRSGDVIPYIVEVVKPARRPSEPSEPYVLDANGVHYLSEKIKGDETVAVKRMIHFFKSMEMDGVKEGTVRKLRAAGYRTIKSILNASAEDFMEIEGFQKTSAKNLERNIQKGLKEATFVRAALASGLFGDKIGARKLQEIIDHYPNIMEMSKISPKELEARIRKVRLFSNLSKQIAVGLPKFAKFVSTHGITIRAEKGPSSTKLANIRALFTSVRDADLAKAIKDNGGKVVSTVKQANVLIVKEGASNNKTVQAEELGIPILTLEKFRQKYKV